MKEKFIVTKLLFVSTSGDETNSIKESNTGGKQTEQIITYIYSGVYNDTYNDAVAEIDAIKEPGEYQIQKLFVKE